MAKKNIALAHYITGGFDDLVVAAVPDDLEIVKMNVLQASEEAQSEVLKDAVVRAGGWAMQEAATNP